jgi:hypothetical protein
MHMGQPRLVDKIHKVIEQVKQKKNKKYKIPEEIKGIHPLKSNKVETKMIDQNE